MSKLTPFGSRTGACSGGCSPGVVLLCATERPIGVVMSADPVVDADADIACSARGRAKRSRPEGQAHSYVTSHPNRIAIFVDDLTLPRDPELGWHQFGESLGRLAAKVALRVSPEDDCGADIRDDLALGFIRGAQQVHSQYGGESELISDFELAAETIVETAKELGCVGGVLRIPVDANNPGPALSKKIQETVAAAAPQALPLPSGSVAAPIQSLQAQSEAVQSHPAVLVSSSSDNAGSTPKAGPRPPPGPPSLPQAAEEAPKEPQRRKKKKRARGRRGHKNGGARSNKKRKKARRDNSQ